MVNHPLVVDALEESEGAAEAAATARKHRQALTTAIADALAAPETESPTPTQLEATYQQAKTAASEAGDADVAAAFFMQEKAWARRQYRDTVWKGTNADGEAVSLRRRAKAGYRWLANEMLRLTAGYGEKPQRVLGISIGVIVFFTGLFGFVLQEGFSDPPPYGHWIGYLLVSLESFVTLVLGAPAQIKEGAVFLRLAAQTEEFLGVFLIALFVFTLTRAIHR